MSEIKVGEYVRLKQGFIGDIVNINNFREPSMKYAIDIQKQDLVFVGDESIVKHSSNIINLLDLGDLVEVIVNEWFDGEEKQIDTEIYEVTAINITDIKGKKIEKIGIIENDETIFIGIEKIVSILTEEQYENNCYKVEE